MSTGDDHSDADANPIQWLVLKFYQVPSPQPTHAVKRQLPKKGRKRLCTGQVFLGTHNLCQNLCPSRSKWLSFDVPILRGSWWTTWISEPPGFNLIESPAQVSHGIAAAAADVPANAWGLVMAQKGALLETKPKTSQNPRWS